jgi:hypothetical protein
VAYRCPPGVDRIRPIGVSNPDDPGQESIDEAVLSRNVVHARVPIGYKRDRHGVFVGNARSIHICDTVATLKRAGKLPPGEIPTPVEGIRVHGVLGPFVVVRHTSLAGFTLGVRVEPQPGAEAARVARGRDDGCWLNRGARRASGCRA